MWRALLPSWIHLYIARSVQKGRAIINTTANIDGCTNILSDQSSIHIADCKLSRTSGSVSITRL